MKVTVAEDEITLDSPEEALFYGLCRLWGIGVERNEHGIEDGHGTWYRPGFRVAVSPGADLWVEVADGQEDAARRHGRNCWRTFSTRRLAVLYLDELHVLMTRANAHAVAKQLRLWAR